MKIVYNIFCLLTLILVFVYSCKSKEIIHQVIQKQENIGLLNESRFEYNYFNVYGYNLNDMDRFYSKGTFKIESNGEYKFLSDEFNPKEVNVHIEKEIDLSLEQEEINLSIYTDIVSDFSDDFQLVLVHNREEIKFSGTSLDTIMSIKVDSFAKCQIKIKIADFYANGNPSPLYTEFITDFFIINNKEQISLYIPVDLQMFYYKELKNARGVKENEYFLLTENGTSRKVDIIK
jgi:hypothetical protein